MLIISAFETQAYRTRVSKHLVLVDLKFETG